ncbi:MAG: hypothetical protein ACRCZ3_15665 [Providencia rustigianii]|uniref:hypothetical protein n=1 Tax=Providencia TaxID=586 RepID=UPI00234B1D06|nr:hypothetical protein [Providencia sp. PROV247]
MSSTTKISSSFWKAKKLPEMEYCSIKRASKLLECEVEDLLHFAEIGAIELCIKLQRFEASLRSPRRYRENEEWESFCNNIFSGLLIFEIPTVEASVSLFEPKYSLSENIDDISHYFHYEYEDCSILRTPLVYLSGLWAIVGNNGFGFFDRLAAHGQLPLTGLNFWLKEVDRETSLDSDEVFIAEPLTEHLYENTYLKRERVKIISTLTVNDLYITKTQINKILLNIGMPMSLERSSEINKIHNKEHYTQVKARENKAKIYKAITKLLAIYPHSPIDDETSYRTAEGKLIIARVAKCLDYHSATLFDDKELPVKDDSRLRAIISEYLNELGCKND